MRTVLLLLRKDLMRRRRAPLGVLVMLAFPLAFSAMLALAFSDSDTGLPAAKVLLHDADGAFVGGLLMNFLKAEDLADYLEVVEVGEEGVQMMEDGEASALLRIPPDTTLKIFNGEAVTFELVRNPAQTILPEIAEQIIATMTDVLSVAVRVLHREADILQLDLDSLDGLENVTDADFALLAVRVRRLMEVGSDFIDSPPLDLEVIDVGGEDATEEDNDASGQAAIFLFILPGIAVYSLFVIGDQMMRDVVAEAQLGTLRRQLSAPITVAQVIGGKVLLSATVAGMALLILASIMVFLAHVHIQVAALVALSLALLLAVSGFAAAIYGLFPDERRGSTLSSLLYLIMAFSGGSFLPLNSLPEAVRNVAHFSPFYWGTQGFQSLLNGGGLAEVGRAVAVLGTLGAVLLVVGTWLLHRHALRGNL